MTSTSHLPAPLHDVKVVDLSRVLSGPLCGSMLSDLGAEVTKVEMPGRGDDSRDFGPHLNGESNYFMLLNRGKRSLTLDLKSDEGRAILLELLDEADVVIENFRPGVMERLGLDYTTLSARNPGLVHVSISGFGQTGPLAHCAAYDHIVQAMGGIMSVTGWADGPPTRVGDAIGDVVAGIYGAWGALAALLQRAHTGLGQHVDVSMLDSMVSLQLVSLSQLLGGGELPTRIGNGHPISYPMDSFAASDGDVVIAVANDSLFLRLARALGSPELADDSRFHTDAGRLQHQADLRSVIESWTRRHTVDQVVELLEQEGVPVAPIWDIAQVASSAYANDRGLLEWVDHPTAGRLQVLPQPVRFGARSAPIDRVAPTLGQHSEEILEGLGLTDEQVAGLRARGIV